MKLKPVAEKITNKSHRYTFVVKIVEEFINSGLDIAEVEFSHDDYANAQSCYGSFWSAINKNRYMVRVIRQRERIFLEKLDYCPYKNRKS